MTSVSVVIPSYNSEATLKILLPSLIRQSCYNRISEIIVVDSSDDHHTKKYLKDLSEKKLVIIHSGEQKVMPAIQRNAGAKYATGDLLLFLDSDVFLSPHYLLKVIHAYNKGNVIGGGSINIPDFQADKKIVCAQYYLYCNEFMESGKIRMKKLLPAANLFCDREFFYKTGGFPEIRASEDSLFAMKVNSMPMRFIFLPGAKVFHIFRESKHDFISTQFLTGKYIFIYRKLFFDPYYLHGVLGSIFLPLIVVLKFLRIHYRMLKSGLFHTREFIKYAPLISVGLFAWGKGFKDGIDQFNTECQEEKIQVEKINRWINHFSMPLTKVSSDLLPKLEVENG